MGRAIGKGTTLASLILDYDADWFVYADNGNGAGFPLKGQALNAESASKDLLSLPMHRLDSPHISEDGVECHYGSKWIVRGKGDNPYRFRVYF
jgi:hypothetical protein